MEGKPKISFSVKKKEEVKQLDSKVIGKDVDVGKGKHPDFISSVDGKKITSVVPKEEKGELVIPLIKQNRWQSSKSAESPDNRQKKRTAEALLEAETEVKKRKGSPNESKSSDALENEAVKEIMKDVSRYNEEWDTRGTEDTNLTIPLLMQNKVPEGFETDDKLDVSIRPDHATEVDYDEIPIEQFGMAMLRGMGWNEKEGIGAKMKANVTPMEVTVRPKGAGLGADRRPGDELKQKRKPKRKPGDPAPKEEEEPRGFTKGAPVLVLTGPHKNLYGLIEGVDEDNTRVVIKFALSSQPATLSQFAVQVVTKDEYKKYSKDLGKFSRGHEEFKKREEDKTRDSRSDSEGRVKSSHRDNDERISRTDGKHSRSDRKDEKSHRHSRNEESGERRRDEKSHKHSRKETSDDERKGEKSHRHSHKETSEDRRERDTNGERQRDSHKHSKKDKHRDRDDGYHEKSRRDDGDRRPGKEDGDYDGHKEKRREERSEHKPSKNQGADDRESSSSSATYWLRPDLRVRLIDASYKKGKYYNLKVKVVDVITRDTCTCQTDEGRFLEDIHQSMVETLIPKTDPAYIMVVSGKRKGQLGAILKRDKKSCVADVQLLRDREEIIKMDYDIICEYAGNIQDEDDF